MRVQFRPDSNYEVDQGSYTQISDFGRCLATTAVSDQEARFLIHHQSQALQNPQGLDLMLLVMNFGAGSSHLKRFRFEPTPLQFDTLL